MLPCTYLWAWLAQKLTDDPVSGLDPVKNVYAFWIKDNSGFEGSSIASATSSTRS